MRLTICALLLCALTLSGASPKPLTFAEVLDEATESVRAREAAKIAASVATERYLQEQSKFRIEWRPRISVLTFSNPALLASSLGASMLFGRNTPSAWSRQQAALDVIAAEINAERAITHARSAAIQAYFDVLSRQQTLEEARGELEHQRAARRPLEQQLESGRLTGLDRANWESGLIAMQLAVEQAELDRATSAVALGRVTGSAILPDVQVASVEELPFSAPIPASATLMGVVLQQTPERSSIASKLDALKKSLVAERRVSFVPPSFTYAHWNQNAASPAAGQGGFLLGSHAISMDVGLRMVLRATKETDAATAMTLARIATLESELLEIDKERRWEVETLRLQAMAARRKVNLLQQKVQLAEEVSRLAQRREQSGLSSQDFTASAVSELARVRSHYRHAEIERKSAWLKLLAISGVDLTNGDSQRTLFAKLNAGSSGTPR